MRVVLVCFILCACALPEPNGGLLSAGGQVAEDKKDKDDYQKAKDEEEQVKRSKYVRAVMLSSTGDKQVVELRLRRAHHDCLFTRVEICFEQDGSITQHSYDLTAYSRTGDFTASDMTFSTHPDVYKYKAKVNLSCKAANSTSSTHIPYITWQRFDGSREDYAVSNFKATDVEFTSPKLACFVDDKKIGQEPEEDMPKAYKPVAKQNE